MLLFNRYQYEPATDLIGKGEFTEVYEALDTHIYLPVAVKIFRAVESTDKFGFVQVDKFCGLDHPNICRYLHVGEIRDTGVSGEKEKRQVCVTELMKDGDFASFYQAHPQPEMLRKMVLDILHGLTYLHSQRIVHRRLKPSNLLVGMTTHGPVVKITDFGLGSGMATSRDARFSSLVVEVTRMAPEQFNAKEYGVDGSVSYHLDFWSLGLAVYDALSANDVLFKDSPGDSREQVIKNILSPRLPEKVMRLPAPFDRFIMRCLAKRADQRPQNTRELIELLSQPVTATPPADPSQAPPVRAQPMAVTQDLQPARSFGQTRPVEPPRRAEPARPLVVVIPPQEDERLPVDVAEEGMAMEMVAQPPPPKPEVTGGMAEKQENTAFPTTVAAKARAVRPVEVHPFFRRYEYRPDQALIGKGGFSRVYKALDRKLDRWVALKFYRTGDFAEKYSPIAEIRRVINLDHPNICRYLDIEELEKENAFGEKESTQVSVMELLDGGNLLEYYAAHPTKEVLRKLIGDVLRGLAYLHRNGIIHRDIKPANILIRETSDGPVAKITDFGVSKLSNTANTNGSSALVVSIPYMAPEQLNVRKYGVEETIGNNLDLWAVGVTIYEVVTGKVLFRNRDDDSNEEIMANILAPGLQDRIVELPQPFLDIVRRCLVRDARRRVQRAEDLLEILNRPEPQPAAKPAPAPKRATTGISAGTEAAADRAHPTTGPSAVSSPVMAIPVEAANELKIEEAEPKPEPKIPPELRLIPGPAVNTQDVFVPEKSWIWAEAVSAPFFEEPIQIVATKAQQLVRNIAFRIAVVAATVIAVLTTYIVSQNNRMSEALRANSSTAQTEEVTAPVKQQPEKTGAPTPHTQGSSGKVHRRFR